MFHRFYPQTSRVICPMLVNGDIYAGLSQLLWADAIFVRDLTRLDLLSTSQLLSMATIMHDCYRSADLGPHLLIEHDRAQAINLAGFTCRVCSSTVDGRLRSPALARSLA